MASDNFALFFFCISSRPFQADRVTFHFYLTLRRAGVLLGFKIPDKRWNQHYIIYYHLLFAYKFFIFILIKQPAYITYLISYKIIKQPHSCSRSVKTFFFKHRIQLHLSIHPFMIAGTENHHRGKETGSSVGISLAPMDQEIESKEPSSSAL